ncbi:2-oxoacid-dependent dioxygenase [Selaginella moellendorffii]|uniref:2-oxoacid-dependent dioxygenase n=1 Tax=Selaginella moellendorffii TaxID=88036 RepID=D8SJV5_SELML|nr:probable 2-oxoglutarate-dependent dioxygenase ANS [Selaginella moellendorffii]EFJ15114.1 2-oxoacid-dependent dioxygenase [Selaginella moellendorffii]|eukprot:XP_002983618.1 probable 2-oxoglutarate-dependent dioxygenase ANS [Selaginella moellendorffii]
MASKPIQALIEQLQIHQSLPQEYVQPQKIQIQAAAGGAQIPVLDLSEFTSSAAAGGKEEFLRELDQACREWGAFQVINHGVPKDILQGMRNAAKHFYDVPVEEKMKYFVTVFDGRPMRYSTSFDSSRDVILEWKDVLRIPAEASALEADSVWPAKEHLPRDAVNSYGGRINDFVSVLLEAMTESLELPAGYLNEELAGRERILAMNFYPPCPDPNQAIGLGAHSDATALTVIVQNQVNGLQLFHKDHQWVTVKMLPEALLVNLGDQLQIISNGRYHSVEHRAVVNKEKLRISVATLIGPAKSSSIAPAPQLVDKTHPALYKPVVFKDYLLNYIKLGLNTRGALQTITTAKTEAQN